MASIIYNSFLTDLFAGNVKTSDSFKGMLVSSSYTESRSGHTKRSDITNEVSGTGYTAGGAAVTLSFAMNNTTNTGTLTISGVSWSSSTITARKLVVYKSTGTASADPLVCCLDNGVDVSSSGTTLSIAASTWTIPLPTPV